MHITTHGVSKIFSILLLLPLTPAHVMRRQSTKITMGRASTFGVIAKGGITDSGNTVVTGNCGTCPGTSITGFPPGQCTAIDPDNTAACDAEADCLTAYNDARAAGPTTAFPSSNLGGVTIKPGVYTFPTSGVTLTGTLTLNGVGNPNGQYIFLITTTFTAAAAAKVVTENGAQCCNVYFISGSSITLGANEVLCGNYIAHTSISVGNGTSNKGTLCALNGAVTLINDALTAQPTCTT